MRAPLARGVRSPALWVSVCWRRGDEPLLAAGVGDDDW